MKYSFLQCYASYMYFCKLKLKFFDLKLFIFGKTGKTVEKDQIKNFLCRTCLKIMFKKIFLRKQISLLSFTHGSLSAGCCTREGRIFTCTQYAYLIFIYACRGMHFLRNINLGKCVKSVLEMIYWAPCLTNYIWRIVIKRFAYCVGFKLHAYFDIIESPCRGWKFVLSIDTNISSCYARFSWFTLFPNWNINIIVARCSTESYN